MNEVSLIVDGKVVDFFSAFSLNFFFVANK